MQHRLLLFAAAGSLTDQKQTAIPDRSESHYRQQSSARTGDSCESLCRRWCSVPDPSREPHCVGKPPEGTTAGINQRLHLAGPKQEVTNRPKPGGIPQEQHSGFVLQLQVRPELIPGIAAANEFAIQLGGFAPQGAGVGV